VETFFASLFFPEDVGSDLSLVFGSYDATITLNDDNLPGSGSGTVNITPEPPSIILLETALLLSGSLVYVRQKRMRVCLLHGLGSIRSEHGRGHSSYCK
jgi:hypothetical protein